jgi:hypothetical protein
MSCKLWYIMFLPFANLHRWCNIIYKYNLFLPWYSCKLLICHSNMTSFKRFEFKPVVKIIYTYTHCNLWHHRQFIMKFYQFVHIRIEIIHGSHMYILFLPRVGLYVTTGLNSKRLKDVILECQMSNFQLYHGKNKLYLYIILHHRCRFANGKNIKIEFYIISTSHVKLCCILSSVVMMAFTTQCIGHVMYTMVYNVFTIWKSASVV